MYNWTILEGTKKKKKKKKKKRFNGTLRITMLPHMLAFLVILGQQ